MYAPSGGAASLSSAPRGGTKEGVRGGRHRGDVRVSAARTHTPPRARAPRTLQRHVQHVHVDAIRGALEAARQGMRQPCHAERTAGRAGRAHVSVCWLGLDTATSKKTVTSSSSPSSSASSEFSCSQPARRRVSAVRAHAAGAAAAPARLRVLVRLVLPLLVRRVLSAPAGRVSRARRQQTPRPAARRPHPLVHGERDGDLLLVELARQRLRQRVWQLEGASARTLGGCAREPARRRAAAAARASVLPPGSSLRSNGSGGPCFTSCGAAGQWRVGA